MRGYLVLNRFLAYKSFDRIAESLLDSAACHGVELIRLYNTDFLSYRDIQQRKKREQPDFAIFWDKDIRLARLLEECEIRLFNRSSAIEVCDDKSLTYISLLSKGIKMPKTIILPKIYADVDWRGTGFCERAAEELGLPVVVKECFGSFGEQVYLCYDFDNLCSVLNSLKTRPAVLQEFISSSAGRDIRIYMVGGKPAASMLRRAVDGDFRANTSRGGSAEPYTPSLAEVRVAADACRTLGLDFAGVDLLFGEGGEPILCEVNSNAHFLGLQECTGVNIADRIIEHILSVHTGGSGNENV